MRTNNSKFILRIYTYGYIKKKKNKKLLVAPQGCCGRPPISLLNFNSERVNTVTLTVNKDITVNQILLRV